MEYLIIFLFFMAGCLFGAITAGVSISRTFYELSQQNQKLCNRIKEQEKEKESLERHNTTLLLIVRNSQLEINSLKEERNKNWGIPDSL